MTDQVCFICRDRRNRRRIIIAIDVIGALAVVGMLGLAIAERTVRLCVDEPQWCEEYVANQRKR